MDGGWPREEEIMDAKMTLLEAVRYLRGLPGTERCECEPERGCYLCQHCERAFAVLARDAAAELDEFLTKLQEGFK